ncbi:flavoprotein [Streptomyces parvulus]|uniref:flavoprotein n=1 Tax=Streptomyces parvulus TaxID=146923 RepID=UPI001E4FB508|nr:flavoprotein [Streptomyces parvulus]MCC9154923.1 flavoprotein [Streptomyces parvulus]MCE7691232.1 flavoprotein [Streptomyces parvulus]
MTTPVLYLFGSAAPPVADVAGVITEAQRRGFDVCLGLTPTAARWLAPQLTELERLTGHPVRSEYKMPGTPDVWPKADVIAVAPATFNTVNSWALGLTHDFVVGVVAEGIGKRIPTVTMPCVNAAYVQHRQFERSISELRLMGVRVLYGEDGFQPNQPGQGRPGEYPWHLVLEAAQEMQQG